MPAVLAWEKSPDKGLRDVVSIVHAGNASLADDGGGEEHDQPENGAADRSVDLVVLLLARAAVVGKPSDDPGGNVQEPRKAALLDGDHLDLGIVRVRLQKLLEVLLLHARCIVRASGLGLDQYHGLVADEADHERGGLLVVEPGQHGHMLKLQWRVITVKRVIVYSSLRCRLRQDQARLNEALKNLWNVRSKPADA